ncbi:MAG: hypothetical protein U0325_27970 [Polyangiales bacterium]
MRLAALVPLLALGCSDPMTAADAARDVVTVDVPRMDAGAPGVDAPPPTAPTCPRARSASAACAR